MFPIYVHNYTHFPYALNSMYAGEDIHSIYISIGV